MIVKADSAASTGRDRIIPDVIAEVLQSQASRPDRPYLRALLAGEHTRPGDLAADMDEVPHGLCKRGKSPYGGGSRLRPAHRIEVDSSEVKVKRHVAPREMERGAPGGRDGFMRPVVVSGDPAGSEQRVLYPRGEVVEMETRDAQGRRVVASVTRGGDWDAPTGVLDRPLVLLGFIADIMGTTPSQSLPPVVEGRPSNVWRVREDLAASQRYLHPSRELLLVELGLAAGRVGLTLKDLRRAFPIGKPTAEVKALREVVRDVLRPFLDLSVTSVAEALGVSRETVHAFYREVPYDGPTSEGLDSALAAGDAREEQERSAYAEGKHVEDVDEPLVPSQPWETRWARSRGRSFDASGAVFEDHDETVPELEARDGLPVVEFPQSADSDDGPQFVGADGADEDVEDAEDEDDAALRADNEDEDEERAAWVGTERTGWSETE